VSPVPGFAKWIDSERRKPFSVVFGAGEKAVLNSLEDDAWPVNAAKSEGLRKVLAPAAAEYFLRAKTEDGKPVDPVARFHLGNGARLERINWLADVSNRGLARGLGLMVNYLYDPDDIEKNHEDFVNKGTVATASGGRCVRVGPTSAALLRWSSRASSRNSAELPFVPYNLQLLHVVVILPQDRDRETLVNCSMRIGRFAAALSRCGFRSTRSQTTSSIWRKSYVPRRVDLNVRRG
jgi:Malonyl-CoA decarboxylase C-terminal domain